MKFLLDMPVSWRTGDWLNNRGHDCVHVRDIGLAKSADEEIFERASAEGRVLITADLDFARILAFSEAPKPGVILLRLRDPRPTPLHDLLNQLFWTYPESQIASSITILEDTRIRIRQLPI